MAYQLGIEELEIITSSGTKTIEITPPKNKEKIMFVSKLYTDNWTGNRNE